MKYLALKIVFFGVIALALFVLGFQTTQFAMDFNDKAETTRCEEDMPCWDCNTMGNKVCGVKIGTAITETR